MPPAPAITSPDTAIFRPHLMAGLYAVGAVNGLIGPFLTDTIARRDILSSVYNTFGLNIAVLLACAIGVRLALRAATAEPANAADLITAAVFALVAIVPNSAVSWIAVSLLSLYSLMVHRDGAWSTAAGSILLAVSIREVWTKLVAGLLATPLSVMDAALVTAVLDLVHHGVTRRGNLIDTGGGHSLAIMLGCSSFHNVSVGLLCWIAITRAARPVWRRSDLKAGAVIIAAIVALNVTRLPLMGIDPSLYERLHGDTGATVFNLAILMTALAVSGYGVRHELWGHCSSSRLDDPAAGQRRGQD